MHTDGVFTQNKPNTDGQIFLSAMDAATIGGSGIVQAVIGSTPLVGLQIPASVTGILVMNSSGLLLRTGILQSNNFATNTSQEAFGTANGPGPSAVSGTSSPSGFGADQVVAPVLTARLPTLKGSTAGAIKKGLQINFVDWLYQTSAGTPPTSVTVKADILSTTVGNNTPVVDTPVIASTVLNSAVNTTSIHRVRTTPTTPTFYVSDGSIFSATFSAVNPASAACIWAGVLLGVSFNFN
jgi:hypothetical protein